MRAVQFDTYGDVDVLGIHEVPTPVPGPGELLVRVRYASVNPDDLPRIAGALDEILPVTFRRIVEGPDARRTVGGGGEAGRAVLLDGGAALAAVVRDLARAEIGDDHVVDVRERHALEEPDDVAGIADGREGAERDA